MLSKILANKQNTPVNTPKNFNYTDESEETASKNYLYARN